MITFDELVTKRRSIRKYRPEIPPDEMVLEMVQAALEAPRPPTISPSASSASSLGEPPGVDPGGHRRQGAGAAHQVAAQAGRPKWMKNRIKFY